MLVQRIVKLPMCQQQVERLVNSKHQIRCPIFLGKVLQAWLSSEAIDSPYRSAYDQNSNVYEATSPNKHTFKLQVAKHIQYELILMPG